jgi:CDP-paratose 2-epimerase
MNIAIVTGSGGLIGSEAVHFLSDKMDIVIGIDNNMRQYFFGKDASTEWNSNRLVGQYSNYRHLDIDIRDYSKLEQLFKECGSDIKLIIHTAAQPSHDWAAKEPITDFSVNAMGTLNLLELTRLHCPKASFIFTSTNKVYGDTPNKLPLIETSTRYVISETHQYSNGIDETMSIDNSKHSVFGASKVAADIMVQEYGKYFGMNTVVFRGGCLTGSNHSGTMLHGFLSYLVKCTVEKNPYTIIGYKGKQVRDNINSVDVVSAMWEYHQAPRQGEVYNIGGGMFANCSVLEAIKLTEAIVGNKLTTTYNDTNREGDHIWYITDMTKFRMHYPNWKYTKSLSETIINIFNTVNNK